MLLIQLQRARDGLALLFTVATQDMTKVKLEQVHLYTSMKLYIVCGKKKITGRTSLAGQTVKMESAWYHAFFVCWIFHSGHSYTIAS